MSRFDYSALHNAPEQEVLDVYEEYCEARVKAIADAGLTIWRSMQNHDGEPDYNFNQWFHLVKEK